MSDVTLDRSTYSDDRYSLRINGSTIYEWYLRPKEEKYSSGYITRYKNPVRSYPTLVAEGMDKYKLGSTLSIKQIYTILPAFKIPMDEIDKDFRRLGWGNLIDKYVKDSI
jgi:hypothetical protein